MSPFRANLLWQAGLKKEKRFLTKEDSCRIHWLNSGIVLMFPISYINILNNYVKWG